MKLECKKCGNKNIKINFLKKGFVLTDINRTYPGLVEWIPPLSTENLMLSSIMIGYEEPPHGFVVVKECFKCKCTRCGNRWIQKDVKTPSQSKRKQKRKPHVRVNPHAKVNSNIKIKSDFVNSKQSTPVKVVVEEQSITVRVVKAIFNID